MGRNVEEGVRVMTRKNPPKNNTVDASEGVNRRELGGTTRNRGRESVDTLD